MFHENWNNSIPAPTCGYDNLEVVFKPRLNCPKEQIVDASEQGDAEGRFHNVSCVIFSNPPVPPDNITWIIQVRT